MKLPLNDHLSWLALRRVRRGGVAKLGARYLEGGHPLGILLAELLDDLLNRGLLVVSEPNQEDGLARVHVTEAGLAHYRTLCRRQRSGNANKRSGDAEAEVGGAGFQDVEAEGVDRAERAGAPDAVLGGPPRAPGQQPGGEPVGVRGGEADLGQQLALLVVGGAEEMRGDPVQRGGVGLLGDATGEQPADPAQQ